MRNTSDETTDTRGDESTSDERQELYELYVDYERGFNKDRMVFTYDQFYTLFERLPMAAREQAERAYRDGPKAVKELQREDTEANVKSFLEWDERQQDAGYAEGSQRGDVLTRLTRWAGTPPHQRAR